MSTDWFTGYIGHKLGMGYVDLVVFVVGLVDRGLDIVLFMFA